MIAKGVVCTSRARVLMVEMTKRESVFTAKPLHEQRPWQSCCLTGKSEVDGDLRDDFDWFSVQQCRLVTPLPD